MIENQANLDLTTYVQNTGKPISFPIFADEVLQSVWGVEVGYDNTITDGKGEPALACFIPSKMTVLVNDSIEGTHGRGCFTLAHEAGHVSLHNYLAAPQACTALDARGERIREMQADQYAAALLMPRDFILEAISEFGYRQGEAFNLTQHGSAICDMFGVSRQALEIRLTAIGVRTSGALYAQRVTVLKDLVFEQMEEERALWTFDPL